MKMKLFATAFLAVLSSAALAQDTASLTGTVRDKSGAIIPSATVVVVNPATTVSRELKTNANGEYVAAALPPGAYDLTVTAPGFQKYQAKGLRLRVAQKSRLDVTMEVGSVNTEVVVQGQGLTNVETESNEEGAVITGKEITQLELKGRNFTQLVTLTPGVTNQTGLEEGQEGLSGNVSFSVNGGRVEYNNWEIDGGDNMDNGSNTTLNTYPSVDAISEFRVLTANYGAQYGRNGSGTVEIETKSGTEQYHGDAYEFLRNAAFNARNYFDPTVPEYNKNDFGYTFGGPVIKKSTRTFFFWSQEWRYDRVPVLFTQVPVPSLAERQGNFNDLCPNAATGSFQDCPVVSANLGTNVVCPGCTPGSPFPGNQVPIDPNAVGLLSMIPNPTGVFPAGNSAAGGAFFSGSVTQPTNWRQELLRVDHDLNSKNRLTFRFIHDSWTTTNPTPLWTNAGSFPTDQTAERNPGVSMLAKLTTTASPTLLNEFVFSYTADHIYLQDIGAFQAPTTQTIGGLFGPGTAGKLPGFTLAGGSGSGIDTGFGEDPGFHPEGLYNSNPTYTFRDNVTKNLGNHTFIFGAYAAAAQKNELSFELGSPAGSTNGFLTFNGSNTAISTGNPFADLLIGNIASFGQQNVAAKYYNRFKTLDPYFQDDWHATKRLTLNLGLRVDLFGLYHEINGQAFNFDPNAYIPGVTSIGANGNVQNFFVNGSTLPNGVVECGVNGVPDGCMKNHLFNWAPRVGFAWDPWGDHKTAVRAGYGIFYEHTNGNESNTESLEDSPPGVLAPVQTSSPLSTGGIVGYNAIGTGGAAANSIPPLSVISLPNRMQWPYIQQWHLDVEHELARNMVLTLAYVGTKGTHLTQLFNLNQIQPLPLAQDPYGPGEAMTSTECTAAANGLPALTPIGGVPITGVALAHLNIACGNISADQSLLLPFPGYANITRIQDTASSIYHAFQASLRRTVGRLQLSANYTWSHSIDDSSDRFDDAFVNTYDLAANRASSDFDQRHVLNLSYIYDLPFFTRPGFTNKVLGGWEWSGITSFATGTPFTVGYGAFPDNAGVGNGVSATGSFPDVVANPSANIPPATPGPQVGPQLYNPNAFVAPRGLTFGDAGRNSLRNPDYLNFDMALMKNFKMKESMGFQFRAEAFNVFNHTNWGYLGGVGGSAASNSGLSLNNVLGNASFLQATTAHDPRILQLALKFLF